MLGNPDLFDTIDLSFLTETIDDMSPYLAGQQIIKLLNDLQYKIKPNYYCPHPIHLIHLFHRFYM